MALAKLKVPNQEIERIRQRLQQQLYQHLIESYSAMPLPNAPKLEKPKLSSREYRTREPFILNIIHAVDSIAREINTILNQGQRNTNFPLCIECLILLFNARNTLPVTCSDRLPEKIEKYFDDSLQPWDLMLAEKVVKRLADKNVIALKELKALKPPLTYSEILSYYLTDPALAEEEIRLWAKCYPNKRYCPECGEVFSLSKGRPLQLFCGKLCSNRVRQRKYRRRTKEVG
jgi:hypothetical protein